MNDVCPPCTFCNGKGWWQHWHNGPQTIQCAPCRGSGYKHCGHHEIWDECKESHDPILPPKAESILLKAQRITDGDRQKDYDHPLRNHERIAALWNVYLECRKLPKSDISAADVATMMILLKIARNCFAPKEDSILDIAGYARCLAKIQGFEA